MLKMSYRTKRLLLTLASGALLLQTAGCDVFQVVQTAALAFIAGTTGWLAWHV